MNRSSSRELDRVASLFTQWRDRFPKGKRPPEPLWTQAVALLDRVPLAVVADRLGVSPKRLAARHAAVGTGVTTRDALSASGQLPARVLELEAAHLIAARSKPVASSVPDGTLQAYSALLEIDRSDGARLRLSLPSLDPGALAALCQAFLNTP